MRVKFHRLSDKFLHKFHAFVELCLFFFSFVAILVKKRGEEPINKYNDNPRLGRFRAYNYQTAEGTNSF